MRLRIAETELVEDKWKAKVPGNIFAASSSQSKQSRVACLQGERAGFTPSDFGNIEDDSIPPCGLGHLGGHPIYFSPELSRLIPEANGPSVSNFACWPVLSKGIIPFKEGSIIQNFFTSEIGGPLGLTPQIGPWLQHDAFSFTKCERSGNIDSGMSAKITVENKECNVLTIIVVIKGT